MKRRRNESGFALLLVFVMAAAISITLFIEVPRIAFESQRAKEQMTIDRGHQYVRAIQLFYRKYKTYPQNLDDLETTRNIRFLRHRYMDPLTGKEWRLLHVGPAGQLTDSLVQPPPPLPGSTTGSGPNATQGSSQGFGASQGFGSSQPQNSGQATNSVQPADPNNPNDPNAQPPDPLNMAARRPSDRIIGGGGAPGGGNAGGNGGEQPVPPEPDPNQPQQPGQPVQQPFPGLPVQQPGEPNLPITPQDPSQAPIPGQPPVQGQPVFPQDPSQQTPQPLPVGFPPGIAPPAAGSSGSTPTPQPAANTPTPAPMSPFGQGFGPGQSGVPGQAGAPGQAGGQQQSAASLIQSILTTPRQPPSSIAGFTSGNTGGIAGVASTADGKGIHVINDRNKYKEWEFIYDLKKDKTVVGAGAVNQQQQIQTQMQQNQNGNGPLGGNSSFGSNSTSSSPFSSTPASSASPTGGSFATPTAPPPAQ